MGGESVLLLWVVKVCHYIRVVKISGEKMNGGQMKLGGLFPGGKKVAALSRYIGSKGRQPFLRLFLPWDVEKLLNHKV